MLTIYDQIQELRVELARSIVTRRERAQAEAELKRLIAEQAKLDRSIARSTQRSRRKRRPTEAAQLSKQDSCHVT
jgi:hypothetical protein